MICLRHRRLLRLYVLDDLDMGHRVGAMPAKLSGGEAQRVTNARARQPSMDHPCRRTNVSTRFKARADRHGSVSKSCG